MSSSDNSQKKRNNYKLLVDPELRKGHKKLYRLNGKDVPGVRRSLIRTRLPSMRAVLSCFSGCKNRRAWLFVVSRALASPAMFSISPRCRQWVSPKTRGPRRLCWAWLAAVWSWPCLASRSAFLPLPRFSSSLSPSRSLCVYLALAL